MFERLVAGFAEPTCGEEQAVALWVTRYRAPSRRIDDHLIKAGDLLGHVLDRVEAAGLPTQFALIPFIESNYRPEAKGQGGPVGLWQFMPSTGRGLGLRIDSRFDGRLSVHQSTVAAIEHLGDLYRRFGDWRAAAMAYNAGEHRLLAALRAAGSDEISAERRLPPGLAPITYAYVAKLRALACLIASPERHGLDFAKPIERAAPTLLVLPPGEFALPELATALGTDAAALRRLNGGHLGDRVRASSPRELLVAATAQPQAADLLALARAPVLEHRVKSGDSLWKIARQHGLALADLMAWNGIKPGTILKPGQLLRLAP
ncbi:MAG: transglycosylase SLT domain-containing protein [Xanthomonadaceae bacterium]|nr:transglycosylase SLT domain-containing protein [Xanthomonadaceae bacterium]